MESSRLVSFVSEEQLDEAKRSRGERVEDGTAQRDRPLFEILKENKDKRDAEFNQRFKHLPPKSLDDDETQFLDNLRQSKREYEQQIAQEDALQLRSFHTAQSVIVPQTTTSVAIPNNQKQKQKQPPPSLGMIIKVKPLPKKPKLVVDPPKPPPPCALVSYSDESDDDDD